MSEHDVDKPTGVGQSIQSRIAALRPPAPGPANLTPPALKSGSEPDWWLTVAGAVVFALGVYLAKSIVVWLCLNLGPWTNPCGARFQFMHALALVVCAEALLWAV